jgi:hypothetical protein
LCKWLLHVSTDQSAHAIKYPTIWQV